MSRHQIDYDALIQDAMRGVVRSVLQRVAKSGLPGEHHFYVSFRTTAPGVVLSKRLVERWPEEMTIVLQNQFSDLHVTDDRFEVTLSFDRIPERLIIPISAIKVFFDPSVPFGHQFDTTGSVAMVQRASSDTPSETPRDTTAAPSRRVPAPAPSATPQRLPRKSETEPKPALAASGQANAKPARPEPPATKKPDEETPAEPPMAGKVVELDAFRKK